MSETVILKDGYGRRFFKVNITDPLFTLDDLEQLLTDHRFWSGDDMTDVDCSCYEWPRYTRHGKVTQSWVEHMLKMARQMKEERP